MFRHYANTPMQYTAIFHRCKNVNFQIKKCNIFLNFAQNIDCGYTLEPLSEAVLTSTHNLCFRAKKGKNGYPCKPQFYYIKLGCKGVNTSQTCYHDGKFDLPGHTIILIYPIINTINLFNKILVNFVEDDFSNWVVPLQFQHS